MCNQTRGTGCVYIIVLRRVSGAVDGEQGNPSISDARSLTVVVTRLRLERAQGLHFTQALPGTVRVRGLLLQRFLGETGIKIHDFS